jgi:hypothetical protein
MRSGELKLRTFPHLGTRFNNRQECPNESWTSLTARRTSFSTAPQFSHLTTLHGSNRWAAEVSSSRCLTYQARCLSLERCLSSKIGTKGTRFLRHWRKVETQVPACEAAVHEYKSATFLPRSTHFHSFWCEDLSNSAFDFANSAQASRQSGPCGGCTYLCGRS